MKKLLLVLASFTSISAFANDVVLNGVKVKVGEWIPFGEVGAADLNPRLVAHNAAKVLNTDCFDRCIDYCVVPKYYSANDGKDILVVLSNEEVVRGYILVNEDGDVIGASSGLGLR